MKPSKIYYTKHKNIFRTYQRLVRLENIEIITERKRKYRETHKKETREYSMIKRQEHRLNLKYSEVLLQ